MIISLALTSEITTLTMRMQLRFFLRALTFLYILPFISHAQISNRYGTIVDIGSRSGIPYVSIGIKGKALGTVADSTGKFKLLLDNTVAPSDSVIFMRVGYHTLGKTISELKDSPWAITMEASSVLLNEVSIKASKQTIETYGRTPASIYLTPKAYMRVPRTSDVSGLEQATILDINNQILLKEVDFLLIRNNFANLKYRINLYSVKNDLPDKIIPTKDIIFETSETRGWKKIDLEDYNIVLKNYKKVAVSVQLLDAKLKDDDVNKTLLLVPSYPSPFKKSFFREKSESEWTPLKNSFLYINFQAYKLKD
ncbi:carboxypeptidase-like regulatory domain-containing protein [Pedobacter sp. G11]|nr:carboxypeptidase-like regulatory domain-containing protein [Pedobacter sp. G11]